MKKVLVLMSGSIACFKACEVISRLVQAGHQVKVAASESALQFVGLATLEGLSGQPVATDTFAPGKMMEHIHLIHSADIVVACPATANQINSWALGDASDLLGSLNLAWERKTPFHIFPAMNHAMWDHPATQASVARLRSWGYHVYDPAKGHLACGEIGYGRLLEPDEIIRQIDASLVAQQGKTLKILITAGGTEVPIDSVRTISNRSTGQTGARLADAFANLGHSVTLLRAEKAVAPTTRRVEEKFFSTFDQFAQSLRSTLEASNFDLVIHAAAVSDYSLMHLNLDSKLPTQELLTLQLKKNAKLINSIRSWSKNPNTILVGFKLTSNASVSDMKYQSGRLMGEADAELVIANDTREISTGKRCYHIYANSEVGIKEIGLSESAEKLADMILQNLKRPRLSVASTQPTSSDNSPEVSL